MPQLRHTALAVWPYTDGAFSRLQMQVTNNSKPFILILSLSLLVAASFGLTTAYLRHQHRPLEIGDRVAVSLPRSIRPHASAASWLVALYVTPYGRNREKNVRYMDRLARRAYPVPATFLLVQSGFPKDSNSPPSASAAGSHVLTVTAGEVPSLSNSFFNTPTGVMVIDPSGRVRFVTYDFVEPEDLKLLTGKYLAGQLSYTTTSDRTQLTRDMPWPAFQAINVKTGAAALFNPASAIYVAFTARCTECTLPLSISAFEGYLKLVHPRSAPILVFSSAFDTRLIARLCHNLNVPIYQASESIPGIEDPDTLDIYAPSEVTVIQCVNGRVRSVQSWDDFVREASKGS
jgi:hypothetical protein